MARGDDEVVERSPLVALRRGDFRPSICAATPPTSMQTALAAALALALGAAFWRDASATLVVLHGLALIVFALSVIWRGAATAIARPPRPTARLRDDELPPYTVIVPLYREARMVPSLLAALAGIDYPRDRLQTLIAVEAGDHETLAALSAHLPSPMASVLIAPPGAPKTKPRACNIALAKASGRHVVVYDAEDRPHPLQLREAAARFAHGGARLACLQAPLRIAGEAGFFTRQFALEYAAQFEIMLPALARLGAPFPLGGTSNHFTTEILKAVGGWDAWNVTEDADLGFRLAARGFSSAMLRSPTWESAPATYRDWRPQRARWVKGYMQTWGVHMRRPFQGGMGRFLALQATLGLAIASALLHGPLLLLMAANAGLALIVHRSPLLSAANLALLTSGWGGAILAMSSGSRRIGLSMRLTDGLKAPLYWALQSVAATGAVWQLCTRPHHWDKTRHHPPVDPSIGAGLARGKLDEEGEASVRRVA